MNKLMQMVREEMRLRWHLWRAYPFEAGTELAGAALFILPYLLYGWAVVGGAYSHQLKETAGMGNMVGYIVVGYVFLLIYNSFVSQGGYVLVRQFWMGTSEILLTAPVHLPVLFLGDAFFALSLSLVEIVLQIILFTLVFPPIAISWGHPGALCFIFLCTLIGAYGIGLFVGGIAAIFKEAWVVIYIITNLFQLAIPFAYPLEVLPHFLQKVACGLPATYVLILSRHYLMGEKSFVAPKTGLEILALLSVAWLLVGYAVFQGAVWYLRKTGKVGTY